MNLPDIKIQLDNIDVIYHCAGEIRNEQLMRALHIDATLRLLEMIPKKAKWVHLSSIGVYGARDIGEVVENTHFNPIGEYEVTKARSEEVMKEYCVKNNIKYTILRPSNVFSVDMTNNALRHVLLALKYNVFFYMKNPSLVNMNYIHVDDVVDAMLITGRNSLADNEDYILSDMISLREFIDALCSGLGRRQVKAYLPITKILPLLSMLESWLFKRLVITPKIKALTGASCYASSKYCKVFNKKFSDMPEQLMKFAQDS